MEIGKRYYACKVIKSVERYIESARVEAKILEEVLRKDTKGESHCAEQIDSFSFWKHQRKYYAIILEELGKSLYDVIKGNGYRGAFRKSPIGFSIKLVKAFGRQLFEALRYLHSIGLTHTDLKVVYADRVARKLAINRKQV